MIELEDKDGRGEGALNLSLPNYTRSWGQEVFLQKKTKVLGQTLRSGLQIFHREK